MTEFRFYINDVEVFEPLNWAETKTKLIRSETYRGLMNEVSLDSVQFGDVGRIDAINNGYEVVKNIFEATGVNSKASFRVDKMNYDTYEFEIYGLFDLDFETFETEINNVNDIVKIGLIDTNIWKKIKNRESLDLPIGANKSIEGVDITPPNSVMVDYTPLPLVRVYEAEKGLFDITDFSSSKYTFGIGGAPFKNLVLPLRQKQSDLFWTQGQVFSVINIGNPNLSSPTSDKLEDFNLFLKYSDLQSINVDLNYNIDFNVAVALAGNFRVQLISFTFDGNEYGNEIIEEFGVHNIPIGGLDVNVTASGSLNFQKQSNRVYFISLSSHDVSGAGMIFSDDLIQTSVFNSIQIDFQYISTSQTTEHKSYSLADCFKSVLQQITDIPNVAVTSGLNQYPFKVSEEAEFDTYVTSGLILRDAINSDDTEPDLICNFKSLWKTANALKPLSIRVENNTVYIEDDLEAFGTNEVEIEVTSIKKSINLKDIFTEVEVGNKPVKYENINGASEPNATHKFSTPLNVQNNKLVILTDYQTDYLSTELARELSFTTQANIDTKYDEKIMVNFCIFITSTQKYATLPSAFIATVIDTINPLNVFNLPFTPKRMLLRNSRYIKSGFWKNENDFLRYESSENLSAITSRITQTDLGVEPTPISERADVNESEMLEPLYTPIEYIVEVGKREIEKILKNKSNLFTFVFRGQEYKGYLWDAEISKEKGTATIKQQW